MKTTKRTLDKWHKLFNEGLKIEYWYDFGEFSKWALVRHWNFEQFPHIYFRFRIKKGK